MQCRSSALTPVAPLQASEAADELRAARQRGGGSGKKGTRARGEDSDDEAVWAAHMESEEEEPDLESLVRSKVGGRPEAPVLVAENRPYVTPPVAEQGVVDSSGLQLATAC